MGSRQVSLLLLNFQYLLTNDAGFHATTSTEFAEGFEKALSMPDPLAVRKRARISAKRFTEEEFARKWLAQMEILVAIKTSKTS
jgi:alpha-1,2-mannosyltransferase